MSLIGFALLNTLCVMMVPVDSTDHEHVMAVLYLVGRLCWQVRCEPVGFRFATFLGLVAFKRASVGSAFYDIIPTGSLTGLWCVFLTTTRFDGVVWGLAVKVGFCRRPRNKP